MRYRNHRAMSKRSFLKMRSTLLRMMFGILYLKTYFLDGRKNIAFRHAQ